MKYLDEEINVRVSGWGSAPADATYGYYVQIQTPIKDNDEWETVFVGNCFLTTTQRYKEININDVVENHKWVKNELSVNLGTGITGLINKWRIQIIIDSKTYTSTPIDVATIYRYPFKKNVMWGYIPDLDNAGFVNMLQGYSMGDKSLQLYPTIPYGVGDNYLFRFVYMHKIPADYETYYLYLGDNTKLDELTNFNNTYITAEMTFDSGTLSNFNTNNVKDGDIYWVGGAKKNGKFTEITTLFDIGKAQLCPAPYYLLWQDRYGGMQSQPFEKTLTYSETVSHTSLIDSKNRTYYINSEIIPKWRINSSWINQKYYPYYESIYCSPYVKLYITETDQLIDVLVDNTEYIEKTFSNQSKNLFNLTLDLSATQNQKILH